MAIRQKRISLKYMCGRMVIAVREAAIAQRLKAFIEMNVLITPPQPGTKPPEPSYNVAPSAPIPVVSEKEDHIQIDTYRWGLIPHWAKDDSMANKCFNARSETMAEKPTFRSAFKKSRCVIPISGYYEWKQDNDGIKHPMYIHGENEDLIYLAGLCETTTQSATVITREAHGALKEIHDRQPIALNHDEIEDWLNPHAAPEDLLALIQASEYQLTAYEVSTAVNNVRNNSKDLLTPL